MLDSMTAKEFWEKKILPWENSRYSPWRALSPTSWSVRSRLNKSVKVIAERFNPQGRILELACGSGHLAAQLQSLCSEYHGIDIASVAITEARARVPAANFRFTNGDVLELPWDSSELTVFLGLTDWLDSEEVHELFAKLTSPEVLFSYTEAGTLNPYRVYRKMMDSPQADSASHAKMYSTEFIAEALRSTGYKMELISKPTLTNPGGLVWAKKI